MKHVFIINPRAGKRDQTSRILTMAEKLRTEHGLDCACLISGRAGGAEELARRAAACGEELRVYACGGDGTLNEVLNGLSGFRNVALTCVPVGTGNDFLKNFGDDMERFSNAENLWDGPEFPLDVIECNGRYALTIACSGIDARVADDVHKYTRNFLLNGQSSYIASLAANVVFKGIGQRWAVTVDGQTVLGEYSLVAVCNGRYYGGGFMPVPQARMNDRILDTLIVKGVGRAKFARFVGAYSKGQWQKFAPLARLVQAQEIRIQSAREDIVTCLDGETSRSRDVVLRLAEHPVRFFGPAGCDCNRTAR